MTHLRRRGNLTERYVANTPTRSLRQQLTTWAADPKTTIPQLRRALDEVIESRPRPEWDAFSLKIEYLDIERMLEQPRTLFIAHSTSEVTYRLGEFQVPVELAMYLYGGQRFLKREPERSRRVVRLIFANWLAHAELPEPRQSRPAVRASFRRRRATAACCSIPPVPKAPAGARVLSPQELASWLVTTIRREAILMGRPLAIRSHARTQELPRSGHPAGRGLYQREHGQPPPSEAALVGPYLQSLPDDGSAEIEDGSMPTVGDSSRRREAAR